MEDNNPTESTEEEKSEAVKTALNFACKALKVAFDATGLEDQIRATMDFPDGDRFFIEFKKVITK